MRWKFRGNPQREEPEIPEDIRLSQADRKGEFTSNVQQGYVPASAGEKTVAIAAAIFVAFWVVILLWLYFGEFLFSNDT